MGICGFSSLDWATCDLANTYRCPREYEMGQCQGKVVQPS